MAFKYWQQSWADEVKLAASQLHEETLRLQRVRAEDAEAELRKARSTT